MFAISAPFIVSPPLPRAAEKQPGAAGLALPPWHCHPGIATRLLVATAPGPCPLCALSAPSAPLRVLWAPPGRVWAPWSRFGQVSLGFSGSVKGTEPPSAVPSSLEGWEGGQGLKLGWFGVFSCLRNRRGNNQPWSSRKPQISIPHLRKIERQRENLS